MRTGASSTSRPIRFGSNRTLRSGAEVADYRIIGLLDMAAARQGRAHRANGDLALHVLEVLDAFERSSVEGRHVMIETPCDVRSRCRSAPARGVSAIVDHAMGLDVDDVARS